MYTFQRWMVLVGLFALLAHAPARAEGVDFGVRVGLDYPFWFGAYVQYETTAELPVGVRLSAGGFLALLANGAAVQLDAYTLPLVTDWGGKLAVGAHVALDFIYNGFAGRTDAYVRFGATLGYETPISSNALLYVELRPGMMVGLSAPGEPGFLGFVPAAGVGVRWRF